MKRPSLRHQLHDATERARLTSEAYHRQQDSTRQTEALYIFERDRAARLERDLHRVSEELQTLRAAIVRWHTTHRVADFPGLDALVKEPNP